MIKFFLHLYYQFFAFLARRHINKHKPYIIGITGSIGKTSARLIIYEILQKYLPEKICYSSPNNFNGELGLSFSILQIPSYSPTFFGLLYQMPVAIWKLLFNKKPYDIILLEYGIDHMGEMDFMLHICKPNISIFTKLDKVHSSQFGSPDQIMVEKIKLLENTKEIIFGNWEEPFLHQYFAEIKIDKFFYSTSAYNLDQVDPQLDIIFNNQSLINSKFGIKRKFNLYFKKQFKLQIETNNLILENTGYIALGYFILDILLYKFYQKNFINNDNDKDIFLNIQLQPGRFSIFKGYYKSIIIDSTYNAAPISMKSIIENALIIQKNIYPDFNILYALGDMRELGEFSESDHRRLAGIVCQTADHVFLVGENMQLYLRDELEKCGFPSDKIICNTDSMTCGDRLLEFIKINKKNKYFIICKGSQNTIFMEETVKKLLLNPEDHHKLPRQSSWWLDKKNIYFSNQIKI